MSQQQFIDTLQPPSAGGNTAEDALLALLDQVNNANPPLAGTGGATGGTTISTGTSARDALAALVQNFNPTAGTASGTSNTAQDALTALIKGSGGSSSSPAATSTVATLSADLARAFSLYQSQLEQRLLSGIGATQSASV